MVEPQEPGVESQVPGYDVIGDVHGCATALDRLLDRLGYRREGRDGPHHHPSRRAVFVGDLVDRGEQQRRVLQIVKDMVDNGDALIVLGNHEFNAMAYATEWPAGSGKYLREHGDPCSVRSAKNEKQHEAFLAQVTGAERVRYLQWFWTLPLWLDLGGIRVVHACWHQPSIDVIRNALSGDRFVAVEQLVRASTAGDPLYAAVETVLKGPEISLTAYGCEPYLDKDGNPRDSARLRWWNDADNTLYDLAEMGGSVTTVDGRPYPALPRTDVPVHDRSYVYTGEIPVFYGHYWRRGDPRRRHDWTGRTACVDFSAVKGGELVAYRWSGEGTIEPGHYVRVGVG